MGGLLALEAFKVGSNRWILSIGVIQGHIQGDSIWDGLYRLGEPSKGYHLEVRAATYFFW